MSRTFPSPTGLDVAYLAFYSLPVYTLNGFLIYILVRLQFQSVGGGGQRHSQHRQLRAPYFPEPHGSVYGLSSFLPPLVNGILYIPVLHVFLDICSVPFPQAISFLTVFYSLIIRQIIQFYFPIVIIIIGMEYMSMMTSPNDSYRYHLNLNYKRISQGKLVSFGKSVDIKMQAL